MGILCPGPLGLDTVPPWLPVVDQTVRKVVLTAVAALRQRTAAWRIIHRPMFDALPADALCPLLESLSEGTRGPAIGSATRDIPSGPIVHLAALLCLVCAGLAYVAAAVRRWRGLGQLDAVPLGAPWLLALGFASLTAALVCALLESGPHDFAYAVLGVWSAVGAVQFAAGWMTAPTRALLALPIGGAALLLAIGGLVHHGGDASHTSVRAVTVAHSVAMATHLAVALVAGGAGGLYLVAVQALKRASPRALRLPPLPLLERLTERALIITTALLMAGLALGGAAIAASGSIDLGHPSIVLALVNLLLLVLAFGLRLSGRLGRRGLALAAVQTMVIAALVAIGLQVFPHGAIPHG